MTTTTTRSIIQARARKILTFMLDKYEPEHAGPTELQVQAGGEILTAETETFLEDPYREDEE
jgi:hypothetical protein